MDKGIRGGGLMGEIKILELSLRNFKGIKDFTITPGGKNINIFGDNATGKTTIMDAFIWLLFDKDSQNSSNFNIKTLDKDGQVIHGLEHEVTGKLDINGQEIELQKIYKEIWTKKRGQALKEFTGNKTEYFINGVPKKKTEYTDYLSKIINEDTFRILTNPLFFNVNLKWQDRRKIALNICGEVEDTEVLSQDEKLKDLEELLKGESIDDLKAKMAAQRKKLNDELKSIPYRIDELSREDLEIDTKALIKEKEQLEGKLSDIKNSHKIDYDFRLRTIVGAVPVLENKLEELKYQAVKGARENLSGLMEEITEIENDYFNEKNKCKDLSLEVNRHIHNIEVSTERIKDLREEFNKLRDKEFDESTTICPTCHQSLPSEDVENMRKNFNDDKQIRLQKINQDGTRESSNLAESETLYKQADEELKGTVEGLEILKEMLDGKKEEKKELENQIANIDITSSYEYKETQERLAKVQDEIKETKELKEQQDNTKDVKSLEDQISNINYQLQKEKLAKDNEKRVLELKTRERELAQMVADTEKIEFLCEQFIMTKSNLLEDKLNSQFKLVRFKLFEKQVNGGINETFVTTVDGVPFEDLNNAMKINAGLDIIRTLSDYYSLKAPIFIDNAESVNELLAIPNQMIRLIVSKHKNLRVEVE